MKKTPGIAMLLSFVVHFAYAQTQTLYDITIIDARNFKEPAKNWKNPNDVATYYADLARHKHHEVNVYRYTTHYQINYFQNEYDSIKHHSFLIQETGQFDKAEYSWSKDTLNVVLMNATGKTKTYKGFGWGGTNSIKID